MIFVAICLLGLLTQSSYGGCPINCNCTENAVNCVSKNLEYVPYFESLTNNPLIIDLSGNVIQIVDIDDFSFDKSDQVLEVFLNNSKLSYIEEEAFEELENLQELYLADNLLNSLPSNFVQSTEIILLDLSNNYFTKMPKIVSDTLEVLAVANSRVSEIPEDALDELPSLRVLLLSENNLNRIDPNIFTQKGNLFFIELSHNPWKCNCRTIQLFDYLMERNFVDLTNPVQCLKDRIFVDIYSEKGVAPAFEDACVGFVGDIEETTLSHDTGLANFHLKIPVNSLPSSSNVTQQNSFKYDNFCYSLILAVSILISLIIGGICGSYVTVKFMGKNNIKQTESQKQLLETNKETLLFNFS